ncbi:hypothetical protein PJ985_23025 [Streptomyces sp. ACA25]|nr:hypothetical protein [Streptomyces sp. ACA25]MDB1090424.1 hypothetical protein [Streptomyces sp. ACA25]
MAAAARHVRRITGWTYAPDGTTVEKLVRIAGTRWAIEERFHAAKNECG